MSYKTQRKFKIRYDRIISVIVIFILAVYVVKQLFGNEVKEEIPTLASGSDSEEFKPVIYLSPSNQTDNAYASGDTTEAKAMRSVSDSARKYLEQNGITVYTAREDYSLQEKVEFANENNVTAHVAIHSNAGGESGSGEGTECFYNPEIYGSKILAEYIYGKVSRLTPTEDRGMFNGAEGTTYLYEVATSKAASCLLEVEFHDTAEHAKWIIEHTDELGRAISDGIMQYIAYLETAAAEKNTEIREDSVGE